MLTIKYQTTFKRDYKRIERIRCSAIGESYLSFSRTKTFAGKIS